MLSYTQFLTKIDPHKKKLMKINSKRLVDPSLIFLKNELFTNLIKNNHN
jgi:hypothetical protein